MTEENKMIYAEKARFVTHELEALVKSIDKFVDNLSYTRLENNEEYIFVHNVDGSIRKKLVTGDSHGAMTVDVLRALGYVD